jgi:hypothetical protein
MSLELEDSFYGIIEIFLHGLGEFSLRTRVERINSYHASVEQQLSVCY